MGHFKSFQCFIFTKTLNDLSLKSTFETIHSQGDAAAAVQDGQNGNEIIRNTFPGFKNENIANINALSEEVNIG